MNIAVLGLGYVGSVSAACLAGAGHQIIGVEVDARKVALMREGRAPVVEPGLDELLAKNIAAGRVTVTTDVAQAVHCADLSLICVGTPSRKNGSIDTECLERCLEQVGVALATRATYHVVAVRSTVLPGVVATALVPTLERASGRKVGEAFAVCVNPEFLREGSAIRDFQHPPFTLIGETDQKAGDVVAAAYSHLQAPLRRVRLDEACLVKYASNAYHALKVAFANEIGAVSQQLGVDGRTVMRVFCEDGELNISPRYLRPGYGYGGSCLPKDLRAIVHVAQTRDLRVPLLASISESNDVHIQRAVDRVLELGARQVALLGLSFKMGSDDVRESPFVRLAEALIGKGMSLRIFDPDLALAAVSGRNRAYLEARLPHVVELMTDSLCQAMRGAQIVIIAKQVFEPAELEALRHPLQIVIDLVGVPELAGAHRPWEPQPEPASLAAGGAQDA